MLLFLIFCSVRASGQAQELNIFYNLYNDEVRYEQDGAAITEPKLHKGDVIVLHLTEFNSYLYAIKLEVSQDQYDNGTTGVDASLMSNMMGGAVPIPGFGGATGTGTTSNLLDIPILTINDSPITLTSLFGGRGSAALLKELETTTADVSDLLDEMDKKAEKLNSLRHTALVSEMATQYLDVLKLNPQLRPTFIKNMCRDYYQAVFQTDPTREIQLNDVLAMKDGASQFHSLISDLTGLNTNLGKKVKTLDALTRQFRSANVEETTAYSNYSKQLVGFLGKSKDLNEQLAATLGNDQQGLHFPTALELSNLQLGLAEVLSNDFTYHSRIQVTGDRVDIKINVEKLEVEENKEREVLKSRQLHFEAKGGLKITGSVGLNFSQYLDPAQKYSINNGLIVGEDDGAFTPTVTSFIHFYSYSGKTVSLGGSFGIGFPLTGTNDNQSLQFFFGPSVIFGTSQRMILNFGLSGGRVNRLSRGFKVGDEFDVNLGDIPTSSPYDFGLFVGASFNLGAK